MPGAIWCVAVLALDNKQGRVLAVMELALFFFSRFRLAPLFLLLLLLLLLLCNTCSITGVFDTGNVDITEMFATRITSAKQELKLTTFSTGFPTIAELHDFLMFES